jgi:probable HAF family extracellular repeat protein
MKLLALLCALLFLQSCGGGGNGGGPSAQVSTVRFSIDWAARGRGLSGPSSALSAALTLTNANPAGGDFTYTVNRDAAPAAYTGNYSTTTNAKLGTWPMTVRFYSMADGTGVVVAMAQSMATVQLSGTSIGTVTTANTIGSVEVMPNQIVLVGATQDIAFTAKDANGNTVAVTPGSATITSSDQNVLQVVNGQVKGLAEGTSFVTAALDGITSARVAVGVATMISTPPQYTVVDLRGGNDSLSPMAFALNNHGQVVGRMKVGGMDRAFLWQNGTFTILDSVSGSQADAAYDINDAGVIVGVSGPANQQLVVPVVFWQNGTITSIGKTDGTGIRHFDIRVNNNGQIAFNNQASFEDNPSIVLWQNGNTLPISSGPISRHLALNDNGDVAFDAFDNNGITPFASIWHNGVVTRLEPPNNAANAFAVNNAGQVAGLAAAGVVIWQNGTKTVLPTLPGSLVCQPSAINNSGDVVGICGNPSNGGATLANPRVALWRGGKVYDITPQLQVDISEVEDINDAGQILIDTQGTSYLLTPK